MYHNKRITKKLEQYIPATKIFEEFSQEAGIAFLDSSLINELGQYSFRMDHCVQIRHLKHI